MLLVQKKIFSALIISFCGIENTSKFHFGKVKFYVAQRIVFRKINYSLVLKNLHYGIVKEQKAPLIASRLVMFHLKKCVFDC